MSSVLTLCLIAVAAIFQTVCGDSRTAAKPKNNSEAIKTRNEKKMDGNNKDKNAPTLETSFNLRENILQIEYKVKNSTAKPIYLFNVLWDFDKTGNYIAAPQPVYAVLRQDGKLHLAKQILPLPKGRKVELRLIPFATKVEAGAEFGEKIELPVPVAEYNPYFPTNSETKTEIRTSESVFFTIQFIRESDELEVKPGNLRDALFVRHPDIFGNLETLSSKTSAIEVSVKKRTDSFDEF